jgi:Mn2+/Fe2+ NRAMP family transporter
VRVLKWLTLALLAYVAAVFAIHISWCEVARPPSGRSSTCSADHVTTLVAVFGTTISPYLFFWQASQEVEDLQATPARQAVAARAQQAAASLPRIKADTLSAWASRTSSPSSSC